MRITEIDLLQLDLDPGPGYRVAMSPTVRISHGPSTKANSHQAQMLRVRTDEGIEGLASGGNGYLVPDIAPVMVDLLRQHAIGEDPLERERLFQLLHRGGRFLYQRPGWGAVIDWDYVDKHTVAIV